MKKYLMFVAEFCAVCAFGAFENIDGVRWFYRIEAEGAVIESFWAEQSISTFSIPSQLGGRKVIKIQDVFSGNESVVSVYLPEGVEHILRTFRECPNLVSVHLPESLLRIESEAFYGCYKLSEVNIPSGIVEICSRTFEGCRSLRSVEIPQNVKIIRGNAFANTGLTNVVIPGNVETVEGYAFCSCSALTSVVVEEGVQNIWNDAFARCYNLGDIRLPSTIMGIGSNVFRDTKWDAEYPENSLVVLDGCVLGMKGPCSQSLIIPEGCRVIAYSAFEGRVQLESITLPSGLVAIGGFAFSRTCLMDVDLPDGLEYIGSDAFSGCGGLRDIVIPDSVTYMGSFVFSGCDALERVKFSSGMKELPSATFWSCSSLRSVSFYEGIENIENSAFYGCISLSEVVLPSTVTNMETTIFDNCTSLNAVYFLGNAPSFTVPSYVHGFSGGVYTDAPESLTSYVSTVSIGWKKYYPESTELPATWHDRPIMHYKKCVINFDANFGAGGCRYECIEGREIGRFPVVERPGYDFVGWFTYPIGGVEVSVGQIATEDVTYYAHWKRDGGTPLPQYGPWGEAEAVKNPDKLGPTMLTDMTLTLNGSAGAVGDVVAAFRGDTGALCGLGKVMDESGTLSMVCYAPTGVKLHFKVWVAASGIENPVVVDCDAKSDLTAPTSGTFLSGHALVVSDDKDLTISLGSADWHTVSFNVLPEDPSPAAVFGSVKDKIAAVTQGIEFWMPGKSSSLKAIEIGKGYWVNTKVDDVEWTVSGKTDPKAEIALEEGWNLVGYAPEAEGAVQAVLKTALAAKAVDYVTYGVEFYPGGTLKKMEPGKAYWVHATKAWRLVYDEVGRVAMSARNGQDAHSPSVAMLGAANGQDARSPSPTYGPWGESEAVKNPDKLGPTFLTDMAVEIDGEPAAYGDVVAVFRGDTGALCGLGKVMDDSGTLTLVCYAPKGVTLSFKVWLAESGVEEAVVVKCDNASKLVAPDVGAFYEGHAISGSTAELIETIVPGEKVTIDTGYKGYTVSGLPSGLKYSKTSGLITGAATKPTAAEGVVAKFTKSGAETEELTIVVTAIPKVSVAMEGVNSPGDTDGCKVTGAGAYLVGKTVTLKATVPKGTVFMGWGDDEGVVATQATYSFTMGKENVNLVAKFKKEVMSVGCETLSSKESFPAGVLGAEGGIKLDISTESGVKSIKVDKLPTGMKYDSKTGLITGAPTKAGDNKVVITVTAKSGAVAKKEIEVKVAAMPVMAVGTFTGFVSVGEDNFGTFTLTTTDAGKLTAKVITAAGTVSFSKTCWDAVEKDVYRATLTTKKGEKLTLTLDSTAAWDANQLSGEFTTAEIAATKKTAAVPSRTYSVSAQKNAFGKTWYFTAVGNETTGWTLDYAATAKAAALTVTLKADGSTAIAGKLPGLPDKKGKATSFKVSASGCANVGLMREGAITADFAPILTVNKVKKVLTISTNLWFDRKNDHEGGVGEARFVE